MRHSTEGLILVMLSNKQQSLVITTSNGGYVKESSWLYVRKSSNCQGFSYHNKQTKIKIAGLTTLIHISLSCSSLIIFNIFYLIKQEQMPKLASTNLRLLDQEDKQ